MIYWLQAILIVIIVFLMLMYFRKTQRKKKLQADLKANWGKPLDVRRNFNLINRYKTIFPGEDDLSANTANDLDLDSVFSYIDRTSSKVGQQYLYKNLHSVHTNPEYFEKLEAQIEGLNRDEASREQIQLKLFDLNNDDAYHLPELFAKKHQSLFKPLVEMYIKVAALIVFALVALLVIIPNQVYLIMLFAVLLANTALYFINKNKIYNYIHSLPQLLALYNVGNWIVNTGYVDIDDKVTHSLAKLSKLKKSLSFINYQSKVANDPTDLTYLISEWIKMFLLLEPRVFISSINKVNQYLDDIKIVYDYIAQIDIAISVQSVRDGLPYYCIPQIEAGRGKIIVKDLYHLLIENCVANSIDSNIGQGVLITGSNMSGKTTFIRAMAVNALLSQTIHTSLTTKYEAPPLNILTSINMSDNIEEQKSYFQAEALSVLHILDNSTADKPVKSLVIIDEIFRGTNTIERIASAKAVLSHLVQNENFVFVSTHDLELAKLLGDDFAVYSFEELMGDNRLVFDYQIKPGLLKNKNGIAVLQGLGYPPGVIEDAYTVSRQ